MSKHAVLQKKSHFLGSTHLYDGKIYWTHNGSNGGNAEILHSNLDGTEIVTLYLKSLTNPSDIALDVTGGKLYWVETNSIHRANLIDGTDDEVVISLP